MTKDKSQKDQPFLYKYSKVVCIFSAALMLLYLFTIGFSIYHSMRPELQNKELFTYDILQKPVFLYGLNEDTKFVFQNIKEKEFEEKKDYLFKVYVTSRKANFPSLISRQFGYIILFAIVFWVHRRLMKQYRVT